MNPIPTTHYLGCVRRDGSELYSSIYIPFKDAKRHGLKADFDLNWDQSTISVLHSPLFVLFLLRFPTMHDIISQAITSPRRAAFCKHFRIRRRADANFRTGGKL